MDFWKLFKKHSGSAFKKGLKGVLGYSPGNIELYKTALTHRSIKETSAENNERLEYLGDAILSALVADYLFKRYPYKEEGFLTEMRSKMVNRAQLNDLQGQVFALLILTVAAAEAAIGLAILVIFYRNRGTIAVEDVNALKG